MLSSALARIALARIALARMLSGALNKGNIVFGRAHEAHRAANTRLQIRRIAEINVYECSVDALCGLERRTRSKLSNDL